MRRITTVLLSMVFVTSMVALTVHVFPALKCVLGRPAVPQHESKSGSYKKVAEISLGAVAPLYFQRMGRPGGEIVFASDGSLLAVGTENGEVLMVRPNGEVVWKKRMGLAKISAMTFSPDGIQLYVGETSPLGSLVCFGAADGRELWRMNSKEDLGINIDQKIYPAILHLTVDTLGSVFAVGLRYEFNKANQREYISRLYRLSSDGRLMQKFPADHNIDAWVGSLAVTPRGERMIFGTANFHVMSNLRYPDHLYCLDNRSNQILWSDKLDVRPPYQTTTVRHAPAMSTDGQTYAIAVGDGRGIAYDPNGQKQWVRELSQPWKIGGSYLRVTPLATKYIDEQFVFFTSTSTNLVNFQIPTPMEHPNGNSVFVFSRQGEMRGKYTAGGMITNVADGGERLALSVGLNIRTKDTSVHGVAILDRRVAKQMDFISMKGPCIFTVISPDGKTVAAIEAPLKLDDGGIIGEYRLNLWKSD